MVQKPLPTLAQKYDQLFQAKEENLHHYKLSLKKSSYGNQIVVHVTFAKNTLQMLVLLIFHEFQ